jgi:dienelactone hydrolase
MAMAERKNIEFGVEGGVTLRGWLFVPGAKGPAPAITMAHGYAGVKEHSLERFARAFAEAGFVVLVHDHRHFGASGPAERGDVDPWQQIADWRRAISFLESLPEVDAAQIGIWGTIYAGGHAIVLGATDRRLRRLSRRYRRLAALNKVCDASLRTESQRSRGRSPKTTVVSCGVSDRTCEHWGRDDRDGWRRIP